MKLKHPVMLMILDGWGLGDEYPGNAIHLSKTPNFDKLINEYPNSKLEASGEYVGLPKGQMGNSEVGHLNIGAGRVVLQDFPRINKDIETGEFFKNKSFLKIIQKTKENNSNIHLVGLVSDGGVHSHNKHLYALLKLMKKEKLKNVFIHVILDGRDVLPTIGIKQTKELIDKIKEIGVGQIATISGRYYSMDRDKRWERTEKAYNAMVAGMGPKGEKPLEIIRNYYKRDITDEFIEPTVLTKNGEPVTTILENDSVIFFNFRPDRARQLTKAFVDENFDGFERVRKLKTNFLTMTDYDKEIKNVQTAYSSDTIDETLSEYISKLGYKQLKIAETEKYAHVTFFLNGGVEDPHENEDRILIPSPRVPTYDMKPGMSAKGIKDKLIEMINRDIYDLIVVNFANPDMVGHTGKIKETIEAIETVDKCMGAILEEFDKKRGKALITADHGNAEKLLDENNKIFTAHTTNAVPLILFGENKKIKDGKLSDIAPTLLDLMEIKKPKEMTGESLIIKED